MDLDAVHDRPRRGRQLALAALLVAIVAGLAGCNADVSRPGAETPGSDSADAGFARDMQVHHIQAVELSMIVRDRTGDPDVRRLAYDVATTQAQQAGQLYGWLTIWGLSQLGTTPPMTWMGHGHTSMNTLMPGMATQAQIDQLSAASGVEAERQFLTLMIAHHRSALDMANAALERATHPAVLAFARGVLASQQSEIDLMTTMLNARAGRN